MAISAFKEVKISQVQLYQNGPTTNWSRLYDANLGIHSKAVQERWNGLFSLLISYGAGYRWNWTGLWSRLKHATLTILAICNRVKHLINQRHQLRFCIR